MRVEVAPAGTDPTSRRYQPQRRGGSGIVEENKWLLLAIVVFIVITVFKYGGNLFDKSQPAAPTPAVATPPPLAPTPPSAFLGCAGWPAVDGEIIQDGRYHERGIYVLDFSEGMVSLLGECREDGTWNVFEPESAPQE